MALKPLNSVGGFSVGEIPANVILANADITANNATLQGNLLISNTNPAWGIKTDNLYYSNGLPWDLQQAAGSNTQVQFNNNNDFGASANFTFNTATNLLTVTGNISASNASLGNLATANFGNFTNDLVVQGNIANANNANITNTLRTNQEQLTSLLTTHVVYGNGSSFLVGSANFTFNDSTNTLTVTGNANVTNTINGNVANFSGNLSATNANFSANLTASNANLGNLATANFVNVSSNLYVVDTANVGNLRTNNLLYANGVAWDFQQPQGPNQSIQFNDANDFGGTANFTYDKLTNNVFLNGSLLLGANSQNQIVPLSNTALEIRGGWNASTGSAVNIEAGDYANSTNWGKLAIFGNYSGNAVGFSEANAFVFTNPGYGSGNVVKVDILNPAATNTTTGVIQANGGIGVSGNGYFGGNVVVTGDIANANNISATNYVNANNANITANLTSGNANLGNLAIASFVQTGQILNGNSNIVLAANGNLSVSIHGTANVVVTNENGVNVVGYVQANGNGTFGALYSTTLTSNSGALTLSAAAGSNNVVLAPSGSGIVDASNKTISFVADPSNPQDAATKAYVDSVATGLQIHPAVRVTSATNLNATYANGGSTLTTIAISGGKTIQFSAAHGLSVGDEIYWNNTFNGISGLNGYFVYSTPAADTITVKATYTGPEVTTLTNGTGLTQAARANSGVGATLTNAGANAALSIDGVALSATNRVLVQGQTNAIENGVYVVTTVGNGSTAWVLTRSNDADSYAPADVNALGYGDYFFVQQGSSYAGSSYVLTTPTGELVFGVTNLGFSQFSAAGSYSAGSGIAITGTTISANTDGVTTDIVSGNIVVKASAQLTTPNIGAATGTSVDLTGNVLAGNVNANTKITTIDLDASGNILAANISANANLTVSNATVNLALSGNTANFTGNVILPNLTVNLQLAGNTANFSGNIVAANANLGNLATANFFTGTLVNGTSNAFIDGTNGNFNVSVGGTANVLQVTSSNANVTGNLNVTGNMSVSNVSGSSLSASGSLNVGTTSISIGTLTTTSITANQTIASFAVAGITGVEFLVKGTDSSGSKYTVATVQAVTDGTSVDFATFGGVALGGSTGSLAVNIVGSNIALQVTPASTNSTVWLTQYRTI